MANELGHVLGGAEVGHLARQVDGVVHRSTLLQEVERDGSNIAILLEDPLLRSDLLKSLDVLEDCVEDLLLICEALFSERDNDVEVGHAVELGIAACRQLSRVVLLLQVAQQRVLTFMANQVGEITKWA